jgi:hypothetical protein
MKIEEFHFLGCGTSQKQPAIFNWRSVCSHLLMLVHCRFFYPEDGGGTFL